MSTNDDAHIEAESVATVRRLAGDIAAAAAPISRWGDGNCGFILDCVLDALAEKGLYIDPNSGLKKGRNEL